MPKVNCPYCTAENDVADYTVKGVEEPVLKKVALKTRCTNCLGFLDKDMISMPASYEAYRMAFAGTPATILAKYNKALDKGQEYANRAKNSGDDEELKQKIRRKLAKSDPQERESLRLGDYLVWKCAGIGIKAIWIQGPRKTEDRAFQKSAEDYGFDYSQNKDWVRATLAVDRQEELLMAVDLLLAITEPTYGMQRVKGDWADPNNEDKNPCAYTGFNAAVVPGGASLPMEIQANTFRMMYGKMDKAKFMRDCQKNENEYRELSYLVGGIPGGLGHALYEIADRYGKPRSRESTEAGKIGTLYNRICRGAPAKRGEGIRTLPPVTMKQRLEEFGGLLAESFTSGGKAAERPLKDGKPLDCMMDVWIHARGPIPPKYEILVAKAGLKKHPDAWKLTN